MSTIDPRRRISSPVGNDGIQASRDGRAICRWANGITPGGAQVVLTNATLTYNLKPRQRVMIAAICMELLGVSDSVLFELGFTDQANGAGTFTPITPERYVRTGAAPQSSFYGYTFDFGLVPASVTYSSGARCITMRVTCNDQGCQITPGWHGWIEQESE